MKQKTLKSACPSDLCDSEPPEARPNPPIGFITLPSESALNAAGRTSDHPFKDLRSTRRVRQRSKKYPELMYSGNMRRRPDNIRLAKATAVLEGFKWAEIQEWKDGWYVGCLDNADDECMDDTATYEVPGQNAHILEAWDERGITLGEYFESWAQRGIAEM